MQGRQRIAQCLLIISSFFLIVFTATSGQAVTHYVSPTGSDTWTNSTNISKPCSLSIANSNADDDDIVYLRGGDYGSQEINPDNNGSSGHVITFAKYTGETPTFTGNGTNAYIDGKSYILFDGLTFSGGTSRQFRIVNGSTYIEIKNCTFGEMSDYGNLYVAGASYIYIHDNAFNRGVAGRIETSEADSLQLSGVTYSRVINNTFTDGNGHAQLRVISITSKYNVIRGNTLIQTDFFGTNDDDTNDAALSLEGDAQYNLFENNTIYETGANPLSNTNAMHENGGKYNIWRKNIAYNFDSQGFGIYVNANGKNHTAEYNTVYSNTWYNFQSTKVGVISINAGNGEYTRYNNLINNIIYTSANRGVRIENYYPQYVTNNTLKNNIVYDVTTDVNWFGANYTISEANSHDDGQNNDFDGNLSSQPTFTDSGSGDFTASDGDAPQVDAGAWLTTITSSTGSGTTFTVDNPYFFYDGWGIPGETGDTIKSEKGQTATITSINYSKGQITVNSSINWTNGEGISLNYQGSRPDIGAIEYSGDDPNLSPPKGLTITTQPN